ncbi:hypothetical protein IHQ68_18710 [Chelatococcus sambhunathii]|uniref:Uncharacterized protein n=1 Tax=Chelatococcus sambhunathii TaxID=363953 RepID=A0ABU1DKJ9_9HYPH|nr:hypothetical protein [Chelatococcus sambhunathii]MDR4308657.1 hypothetical protein [Chelatococcus sambhunathii]
MTRCLLAAAALAAVLVAVLGPAGAVRAQSPAAGERYELKPIEGGFLRLDRETGLTALCKPSGDGYACRPSAEGRSADAAMIAALEARVAALEAKVKALSGDPATGKPADPTLSLPSDEQVDRVAGFLERALKRLKKIAEEAQKDDAGKL